MNAPTFCSPYFALLETYAPQLLAGPEGHIQHTGRRWPLVRLAFSVPRSVRLVR